MALGCPFLQVCTLCRLQVVQVWVGGGRGSLQLLQRTPDNLAAFAGTARGSADASAQTKYLSAFGLMYQEALVVELGRAFKDIRATRKFSRASLL